MTVDVRARLAEGAAAVAGQTPQIQQWYYAEDGLRLDALDADSAALAAAASMSEEALHVQHEAVAVLAEGWRSGSGSGAVDFVARHCGAAAGVVAELRSGAGTLSALSENLRRVVDSKVEAVLDGSAEWVAADSPNPSAAVYGEALARLGELPAPRFETPLPPTTSTTDPGLSRSVPPPSPLPSSLPAQQTAPSWASGLPTAGLPTAGLPTAGLPNLGGSLAGLINQIAQALGPYSDTPADLIADPQDDPQDGKAPADPMAADSTPAEPVAEVKPAVKERHSTADAPLAAEVPPPVIPPPVIPPPEVAEPPAADPPAPPAEPAAAADTAAAPDTATPCEIAADELPQVGQ